MANIESSPEFVSATYKQMRTNIAAVRKSSDRPLPLAEKVVFGHIDDVDSQNIERGKAYLNLRTLLIDNLARHYFFSHRFFQYM
ncbi:MAG: hypothetical protein QGF46_02605, partial [Planctomycetota bacterium]|nr:hypothetical protein [Planctomycetota bacterium]